MKRKSTSDTNNGNTKKLNFLNSKKNTKTATFVESDLIRIKTILQTHFEKVKKRKTFQEYAFELWIDIKEPEEIRTFFTNLNLDAILIKQLYVGDYFYVARHKKTKNVYLLYCVERKSWTDFFASLTDGRYRTQKYLIYKTIRLLHLLPYNVTYLFEKNGSCLSDVDNHRLEAAKIHLFQRDKITIFETDSINHTIYRLCLQLKSLEEHKEWTLLNFGKHLKSLNETKLYDVDTGKMVEITVDSWIEQEQENDVTQKLFQEDMQNNEQHRSHFLDKKTVSEVLPIGRKKNRTPQDQFFLDLRNRNKCGPQIAKALTNEFTSLSELRNYIQEEEKNAIKYISQIELPNGKRKIGKKTAKSICESLLTS